MRIRTNYISSLLDAKQKKKMLVKLARTKKYTRKYRTVNNCGWKSSNTILYFLLYCSIFWEIKWYMNYEGIAFKDKPLKFEEKECHRCVVHYSEKANSLELEILSNTCLVILKLLRVIAT